jgi:signal transduction histidine kinase
MTVVTCVRDSVDEQAALREEIVQLKSQLARAQGLASIGTMAAMVAHEFNNILTPVLNYAMMASDGNPVMLEKCARFSLQGAKRACAISKALLAMVNQQASDEPEDVNVGELVAQVLDAMARDMAKDGITLVTKVPEKLSIRTRPAELAQVLLNLLLNARWAVLEKGRGHSIQIEATRQNGQTLLRVSDTGIGISPENLPRIFEAFFTTRSDNGTGLGLAVCKHVVESLGGQMTVRSELGKGTCFTIALPTESKSKPTKRKSRAAAVA